MIRRTFRRPPARRGAILLVVLGMLALFAVVGLSFVLYAESEATGARNNRAARNELADPDPATVANAFGGQLIFGTSDPNSPLYLQDLATGRFGQPGTQSPYTGSPLVFGTNPAWGSGPTLDQTQVVNLGRAFLASGGTFPAAGVNRAVPWTYPDRNNFYLAYYDPATDQVTVPSFYRPDLFGTLAPPPANANWTNPEGLYLTVRPRPAEHPAFPTVPMNADGTYTGDVSNLKFLTGNQKNDSLWMDLNLPIKEWRGKRYKAMVAPLVLDLGGKIDLRVAGNSKGFTMAAPPPYAHGSHGGWGPWEVNPTALLAGGAGDLTGLLNLRYNPTNLPTPPPLDRFRNLSTGTLNRGLMSPQYSRFDASGTGTGAIFPANDAMALPTAGLFSPFPNYNTGAGGVSRYAGSQSNVAVPPTLDSQLQAGYHGQSFSPYQWPRAAGNTTNNAWVPSLEDQLRLQLRSGGPKGNPGYFGQFNPNPKLTTLFSASQRWGEIRVPVDNTGTNFARLAAIDITRPLPDYRTNLNGPVSPQNVANLIPARVARQNLARDIFVRLAAVDSLNLIDGTNAFYTPTTGYLSIGWAAGTPQFARLQLWAQYAANMVDQIDSDDISTTFVWNPVDPTQYDVNDTVTGGNANVNLPNFAAAQIASRTVYGTELPKVVLNEVFSSLINSRKESTVAPNTGPPPAGLPPKQAAKDNVLKKYWIELHNPLSADAVLPDNGAARLQYDPATTPVFDAGTGALAAYAGPKYSPYQIEIAEVPAGAAGVPSQPYSAFLAGNPLGGIADSTLVPGMATKVRLTDYTAYNAESNPLTPAAPIAPATDTPNLVPTSDGSPGPKGYFLIGPRDWFPTVPVMTVKNDLNVIDQDSAAQQPTVPANPALKNALIYDAGKPSAASLGTEAAKTSVVLLRRLVNPYLLPQPDPTQANYNPYMTVDFLENVPVRDRVEFDDKDKRAGYPFPTTNGPTVGRKHPYAAAPCYGTPAPALAAVADQVVNPAVPTAPAHTFQKANSTLDNNRPQPAPNPPLGLEWLAHLDREPVNAVELLMTSVQSPAQLTQKFYDGALYQKHVGVQPAGTAAIPLPLDATNFPTAFRAYDLLSVGSRLPGIPLGGREPGRVNVNTAGDAAILQAVLDPQSGNTFAQNPAFTPAIAWAQLLASRTKGATVSPLGTNNLPGATVWEGNPTGDQPFQPGGGLYTDSLLRQGAPNVPVLFSYGPGTNGHPSMYSEPARKGWNNLTTVSDGFLVAFTVGFFEVDATNRLGKEIYDKVPGDLRAQYAGVVDRTAITQNLDLTTGTPTAQPTVLGPKPWETKLVADAPASATAITVQAFCPAASTTCTVYDDGAAVTIQPGTMLRIGYADIGAGATGGDGEWVKVATVAPGTTVGTAVIAIDTTPPAALPALQYSVALQRFHGGNSRVSNAAVGHPGPQPAFDYREPTGRYRGVLPFFMRMVP